MSPGESSIHDWLRLALAPNVGPVLARRLLDVFGGAGSIFAASRDRLLEIPGVSHGRVEGLFDPQAKRAAKLEAALAQDAGVGLVALDDPAYPDLLKSLPYPPLVLWTRGRLAPEDRLALAIVGPRSPSPYARLMAEALAPALASHGLTLVSGLAHGIDAVAHRAALDAPAGRTLAVLGQGLGTPVSPEANRALAERIAAEDKGALISIFPMATPPSPGLFPQRNEIMAGLALGTLVVEASPASGGLITARHAASFGRTVLACPGDVTRRAARGSNRLIADGAALVQEAEDVPGVLGPDLRHALASLRMARQTEDAAARRDGEDAAIPGGAEEDRASGGSPAPAMMAADPMDAALLAALDEEPMPIDALADRLAGGAKDVGRVQQRLLLLELDGRVKRLPGQVYALSRRG